jgi:hypothetical protein
MGCIAAVEAGAFASQEGYVGIGITKNGVLHTAGEGGFVSHEKVCWRIGCACEKP